MYEKYEHIVDESYKFYKTYMNENFMETRWRWCKTFMSEDSKGMSISGRHYTKEEFVGMCKNDGDFSKRWNLKIEERELIDEEKVKYFFEKFGEEDLLKIVKGEVGKYIIPTKLITITYNNETIEIYE